MTYRVVEQRWDSKKDNNRHERGWVCRYCKKKTTTVYIATSHDHTDERVNVCTCGVGRKFQEVWPTLTRGIYPTYPMEYYKEFFA